MSEISVNTLMLAISSMNKKIDWTVQRIKDESPEIDEQEAYRNMCWIYRRR